VVLLSLMIANCANGFITTQFVSRMPTTITPAATTAGSPMMMMMMRTQRQPASMRTQSRPLCVETTTTASTSISNDDNKVPFPIVVWRFTRPHTLIGSALAIPALHALAAPSLSAFLSAQCVRSIVVSTIPALLMNLYITGLNQITDVEIDKINKPELPMAAGILKRPAAIAIVLVALTLSLGMAHTLVQTQGLYAALYGSALLGTLYSLEPVRLKQYPLLAAICIVAVRGTIINASFFAHAQAYAFGQLTTSGVIQCLLSDTKCTLSSLFFCVFGIVIAMMKDVPDVLGDRAFQVKTLSVQIGQERVFRLARRLLTTLFVSVGVAFGRGAVLAPTLVLGLCRGGTAIAALLAGGGVRRQAQAVDPEDNSQVYTYYMYLWKLFYVSYLVLPFAR
jgi:homogentisate phytyltransferase/homogentisate geranylgeranyltransferase